MFEDTKGLIRTTKSTKYRLHNDEKNRDKKTKHDKQNTTPKTKDWTKTGAQKPEPLQVKDTKMVIKIVLDTSVHSVSLTTEITTMKVNVTKALLYSLFDCLSFLCILIYQHLMHLTIHVLNLYTSIQRYR